MFDELLELDAQLEGRKQYTTIIKIGMTAEGQFCVGRSDPIDGFLDRDEILAQIPAVKFNPVTSDDPFEFTVIGRQRLVFTLAVENWFFQSTIAPFTLKTNDPYNNFVNQVRLRDDPINEDWGRSKTIYVDDENKKKQDEPYVYNLYIDMWQKADDPYSAITPVVIDPKVRNGGGGGG